MTRFMLFRGINESTSRNIGSLFTWQSTILNFVSFMVIGLFGFCAAEWYDFIPARNRAFFIYVNFYGDGDPGHYLPSFYMPCSRKPER